MGTPKILLQPIHSKLVAVPLAFDDSPRGKKKRCAGSERDHGRIASRVREQTQRQPGGGKFGHAGGIAHQAGRVAGIEVADDAQVFVVAARECGAGMHALRRIQNRAIELQAKLHHGIGFVDVIGRKQAGSQVRNVFCACERMARVSSRLPATSSKPNRTRSG